jgi:hypothetical protein
MQRGFLTWTLMLAPNGTSGHEVCPNATLGCRGVCLGSTGCQHLHETTALHVASARFLLEDRTAFMRTMSEKLDELQWTGGRNGLVPCARLNNLSDLDRTGVAALHPGVVFYDYTKRPDLMRRFLLGTDWPRNYHLTFSRSEENWPHCQEFLEAGGNVAVVFRRLDQVPPRSQDHSVVDGSTHDLRFLDLRSRPGSVVALRATPEGRRDRTGFVVDL